MEKVSFAKLKRAKNFLWLASFLVITPVLVSYYTGLTGKIIVSTDMTRLDPHFNQTVIYIFDNSYLGAHGLVLNREPSPFEFKNYNLTEDWPDTFIFKGGPIFFPKEAVVLLEKQKAINHWRSAPLRVEIYDKEKHADVEHVYLGIASWGAYQLEREVKGGVWTIYSCDVPALLNLFAPLELWSLFQQKKTNDLCVQEKVSD